VLLNKINRFALAKVETHERGLVLIPLVFHRAKAYAALVLEG